jgi:hypothetical protein
VPAFQWDPSTARFRDPATGRYISRTAVRQVLDGIIVKSQARITVASNALRSGAMSIEAWELAMGAEIKSTHLASLALSRGGWARLTPADFGRAGARIKVQYQYLANFTSELIGGVQITDGSFMSRARLYAASGRPAFHVEQQAQLQTLGYTEERNVLHPAEHCGVCVQQSAAGWVPIGSLIPIGQRQCLGNDHCSISYR